jgi:hypothetical protein
VWKNLWPKVAPHQASDHSQERSLLKVKFFLRNKTSGNIRECMLWENLLWKRLAMCLPRQIFSDTASFPLPPLSVANSSQLSVEIHK